MLLHWSLQQSLLTWRMPLHGLPCKASFLTLPVVPYLPESNDHGNCDACSALESPGGCCGVTSPQSVSGGSAMASRRRSSVAGTPESAYTGDKLQVRSGCMDVCLQVSTGTTDQCTA